MLFWVFDSCGFTVDLGPVIDRPTILGFGIYPIFLIILVRPPRAEGHPRVKTYVSMEPWIPGVTDPIEIMEELAPWVDRWIVGTLNYQGIDYTYYKKSMPKLGNILFQLHGPIDLFPAADDCYITIPEECDLSGANGSRFEAIEFLKGPEKTPVKTISISHGPPYPIGVLRILYKILWDEGITLVFKIEHRRAVYC